MVKINIAGIRQKKIMYSNRIKCKLNRDYTDCTDTIVISFDIPGYYYGIDDQSRIYMYGLKY